MLVFLAAAMLQASTPPAPTQRDVQRARRDSIRAARPKKEAKRIPVTPEHIATAFGDSGARDLLHLARAARLKRDETLQSYDATTYERISAGLGFAKVGRDRLAYRSEEATKVRWRRGIGSYVDITGARAVVPIAGMSGGVRFDGGVSPIPFIPGNEQLIWIGSEAVSGNVNENDGIIHPLADGSEAYYTYSSGDSATFRLPDGKAIRLKELQVRPRAPKWNLAVASLWFDLSTGELVRAAYRMSVPMDIGEVAQADDSTSFNDVPRIMKPMMFPMTASVSAIGVEYGLYQGRFWLPRVRVLEGGAGVGFMRSPFKLEQKFAYDNVNAGEKLPPIVVPQGVGRGGGPGVSVSIGGSPKGDSIRMVRADSIRFARADSMRLARGDSSGPRRPQRRRAACDTSTTGTYTYVRVSNENRNVALYRVPCDTAALTHSADLPKSIYDANDETFRSPEMDELVKSALSMGAQAGLAPALPVTGFLNLRYNRVEGLSGGVRVDQQVGNGYSWHALGRIGIADLQPNAEVGIARSDLRKIYSITAYNRLVSASDWGDPLSLGSSISAFLFGRDDGFYYRASGIELSAAPDATIGGHFSWTAFVEQERPAVQKTTFSIARLANGYEFQPNITARRGTSAGVRSRYTASYGLDPEAFRLFSDWRAEGAGSDSGSYGRFAADLTASHALGRRLAALTVAGGTSVGAMPVQRYWFLGGTQTVRGLAPGTESGNAFWLARGELALNQSVVRPTLFGDLGWAGDRNNWKNIGVPMSGAGIGFSLMDGLVRFDVSHGINPVTSRGWRVDTYVEARF